MKGGVVPAVVALVVVVVVLAWGVGALVFQWAWNSLMPLMWHAAPILTFWQAVAATVLLSVVSGLFKVVVRK